MQRLFGIETEYGITLENEAHIDAVKESIELIKSYRKEDFRPMWDYGGEDPFRDERGFRAKTLSNHPDEKEAEKRDRRHNLSFAEIKSDRILGNGARLYNDHAHPEYSTPECSSLFNLVAHDKAGERILQRCAETRSENLGKRVLLYKNNTDFHGHSYGCHDNYLMAREVPFEYLKESILPFFVTRQIFAGAGKLGIETEAGLATPGHFQLAQRSDFFHVEASIDTMHQRPIFNTRDEPHADATKYRRLHGIVGDANMSEYATALKVGTTALVIALIEARQIPMKLALANPIDAIKTISHDQGYRWLVTTAEGKTMSAIDHQREYLALAQKHFGQDAVAQESVPSELSPFEFDWVLTEWEDTLNMLEREPMALTDRLDWVAKKWLLETFAEEENLDWDDPWLQSLDLEYHNVHQEEGLFYGIPMRRVVTDEQIAAAIHAPPNGTRAYFRGNAVNRFSESIKAIQWDSITFRVNGRPVAVDMDALADAEIASRYNTALDESPNVETLIKKLGL